MSDAPEGNAFERVSRAEEEAEDILAAARRRAARIAEEAGALASAHYDKAAADAKVRAEERTKNAAAENSAESSEDDLEAERQAVISVAEKNRERAVTLIYDALTAI